MEIAIGLLAIVLLILANGWFVLGEFAYVAARRPNLEAAATEGDVRAHRALSILQRLSFMLSGAQLGITITSLLIGYLSEPVFSRALGPVFAATGVPERASAALALTTGLILATSAQMILGELAPKNLGIARAEPMSLALARPMRLYLRVAGPVIALFDGAANRVLRAVGVEPVEHLDPNVSTEELGLLIEASGEGGVLTEGQAALLSRVLAFQSLRAADALIPRPQITAVGIDASCDELRRTAVSSGHSRFPVVGEGLDDVRGVVQVKDIFRVPAHERGSTTMGELMQSPLVVPETTLLGPLLADLRRARSPLAVVVDEHGGTAGVVSLEDLVEELVGQIRDEYDPEEPNVVPLGSGAYLVPGSWRPDEIARDTGIELPGGEFETIGGLVMERLGRVPRRGDVVDLPGLRLRVVETDGHAVSRLTVAPRPVADDDLDRRR